MRRFVPRALLTAAVAVSAAACASSGGGTGVALGSDTGGRYIVMIPALDGPQGDRVANELRALVSQMSTHTALAANEIQRQMREYDLAQLDEITARQLAQQMRVELVSWGSVREGGQGLQADILFVDTRTGDQIEVAAATGATPQTLAQAIFGEFNESIDGIRQAAFCNDYLSSQAFQQALDTCEAALVIVPGSISALYGKATALLNLERFPDALTAYRALLAVEPTHQNGLLGAGLAASRLEQSREAMEFYNRYLAVNPGNVQVRMTVANDVAQTGDYVSAFRVLEGATDENADNVDFQRYLFAIATAAGQRAQEQNDPAATQIFSAALAAYQAAYADAESLDANALRQAIAVNNALGRTDEAIRLARDATQRFSDDAAIWSQYATVLTSADDHAEAARALTRVIEIDPAFQNAYIRRAQAYLGAGQRQSALADLERAAETGDRQQVATVLYNTAAQAFTANNFTEAASILSTAYNYATGDVRSNTAFLWAFSLFRQGETIARANTAAQPNVQQINQALALFRQALPLAQSSSNAQAGQVVSAVQQYIQNQEALLGAVR